MGLFVCKQKTAYELRISDWSSDVFSSDLSLCQALDGGEYERLAPLLLFDQVELNQPDQVCPRRRIGHPVCSLVSGDLVHAARMTNGVQKQGALAVVQGCTQS